MTIDKTRILGGITSPVLLQLGGSNYWRIRTDVQPEYDEGGTQVGASFIECEFDHKPTLMEVKDYIHSVINSNTDEKILSGMVWNNHPVWLSAENQKNFSEAQRVAQMMPEAILPVTFKLGEGANGEAVYYTFETTEELTQFYLSTVAYINQCLQEGWQAKDNFDFTPYEQILNPTPEESTSETEE